MSLQCALGCKTLSTNLTGEGLLACKYIINIISWQQQLPPHIADNRYIVMAVLTAQK